MGILLKLSRWETSYDMCGMVIIRAWIIKDLNFFFDLQYIVFQTQNMI